MNSCSCSYRSFLLVLALSCLLIVAAKPSLAAPVGAQDDNSSTESVDDPSNSAPPIDRPAPADASQPKGISLLRLLTLGGWFMVPLLILSVVVVTIGVERFLALRRQKVFPREMVRQLSLLSQSEGGLDPRRAYEVCQRYPSSAAYIMRSLLVKVGRPQSEMESAVNESAQREATRLAQMSSWLTLAAAIAPLIGLLGTVWGITQAFYDTTQLVVGQNRAEALAQGIYTALVTTMTGLLIAIPAAVLSHHFENRIMQLMNQIEELCFNLLPQFERYEGKLRFTTGVLADEDAVLEQPIDAEAVLDPVPPPRRNR